MRTEVSQQGGSRARRAPVEGELGVLFRQQRTFRLRLIEDCELSSVEFRIGILLSEAWLAARAGWRCDLIGLSQDEIADRCGTSRRTVMRGVARLVERGHITVRSGRGRRVVSQYRLATETDEKGDTGVTFLDQGKGDTTGTKTCQIEREKVTPVSHLLRDRDRNRGALSARPTSSVPVSRQSEDPVDRQDPVEVVPSRVERAGPPPSRPMADPVEGTASPPVYGEVDIGVALREAEAVLDVPEIAAVAVEPADRDPTEADRAAIARARVALASRGWSIERIEQTASVLRESGSWGEPEPVSPSLPFAQQVVALVLGGLDLDQLGEDRVRAESRDLVDRIDVAVGRLDWLVDRIAQSGRVEPVRGEWTVDADADEEQELEEGFAC